MNYKQAQSLKPRDIVHYTGSGGCSQVQGKPVVVVRYRVNGAVKRWKTDPYRVQVPIKHGLNHYGYINNDNLTDFHLESDCPLLASRTPLDPHIADLEND